MEDENRLNSLISFCSASSAYLSDFKLYFLITCFKQDFLWDICVSSLLKSSSLQVV